MKDVKVYCSWISRVGTWGSDLVNVVGDGLNYLVGYDEFEVIEGGEEVYVGEYIEVDVVDDRKVMWG